MLQKFKITSCAFILVLFGLTLMTVSPVLAADGDGEAELDYRFTVCENMPEAASKLSCFRDIARSLRAAVEDKDETITNLQNQLSTASSELQDKDELTKHFQNELFLAIGLLQDKDARIADLQEQIANLQSQLSTASSELQDKDETIADLTDRFAAAMEGSTQDSGAGTASDNRHLNGEGPQEHFWPCTRDNVFGGKKECMVAELTEWRDGCEGTFEAMNASYLKRECRDAMREAGK